MYDDASENVYTFKSKILIFRKEYVDKMSTHNVVMLFSSYQCTHTLFIFMINMMGIFICIADIDLLLSKNSV